MSSPAEYYKSLPPITKAYGTTCLLVTIACQIGIINGGQLAMIPYLVFFRFEVWRLITTFFFLGKFSINFGIRLLMIARYGVQLENGPFQRRTADFLWMMLFGAFSILAFYLPWAMLCLDAIFGSPVGPDFLGIIAGHLYYFLTVLHPLAGGTNILKTPILIHKIVARWRIGAPTNSAPQHDRATAGVFRGRSHRLGG
ncbi:derlin-1-like isoform X2 [Primulina huaijiensis]|uniref:derlin-1-like isoform X2 n=1 Tax=Primulina huaijiensis TaxID=1492673 RepID=UPI003CC7184A